MRPVIHQATYTVPPPSCLGGSDEKDLEAKTFPCCIGIQRFAASKYGDYLSSPWLAAFGGLLVLKLSVLMTIVTSAGGEFHNSINH